MYTCALSAVDILAMRPVLLAVNIDCLQAAFDEPCQTYMSIWRPAQYIPCQMFSHAGISAANVMHDRRHMAKQPHGLHWFSFKSDSQHSWKGRWGNARAPEQMDKHMNRSSSIHLCCTFSARCAAPVPAVCRKRTRRRKSDSVAIACCSPYLRSSTASYETSPLSLVNRRVKRFLLTPSNQSS